VYTLRNPLMWLPSATLVLMISACGFQLRGAATLGPVLHRLAVADDDMPFISQLENALRQAGTSINTSNPDYFLRVLALEQDNRNDSLSENREEIEMTARLRWQLEDARGQILLPQQQLERRSHTSISDRYNASALEQETAQQALLQELARALVDRLGALEEADLHKEEEQKETPHFHAQDVSD